ncbi:uncharacterized protein METZ01_LOCUS298378, partial [marine metagenome]
LHISSISIIMFPTQQEGFGRLAVTQYLP